MFKFFIKIRIIGIIIFYDVISIIVEISVNKLR